MKMKLTCLARLMICCAAQARQPNIIYIITDDWGIGKVPCYKVDPASQNIIKAPNPDRLRVQGMLFTNADAGGHPITGDMDGISIMPTLSSNPEKQAQREYLYFEFYEKARQQSVRMGNWKAIRNNLFEGDLSMELYDLASDIEELTDVAGENPETVRRIEQIMRQEHEPSENEKFRLEPLNPIRGGPDGE